MTQDHKTPTPAQPVPAEHRRVRGVLTFKAGDDVEFRADRHTGLSSQQLISKTRASRLYRTVGEKQQSMVMHCVAPADCPDPRAYFTEQAERLTQGMATKARPKVRGVTLADTGQLRIVWNKQRRVIEAVLSIDLNRTPAYNSELINLMQQISQCFAINQTSFLRQKS